ncbi:hypothetical protein AAFN60_03605 [Roseibacillus persicicus]|uniref:hypothetical protein n=1 Tax=Roseibacillus persicicus TaxID=454148 RepID=UPI00398B406A
MGCLLWFIVAAFLWGGGQSFYTGITNRKMTTISIEELSKQPTKAKWLRITGGELDVSTAAYTSSFLGDPKVLYIPVTIPGAEDADAPVSLLYKTTEDKYLELGKKMKAIDEIEDENKAMMALVELAPQLLEKRDVEGLVQFGIESDSGDDDIRELFDNISPDALIIEPGEKPSWILGLFGLIGGLALGYALLRAQRVQKVPNLQAGSPVPPTPPAQQ